MDDPDVDDAGGELTFAVELPVAVEKGFDGERFVWAVLIRCRGASLGLPRLDPDKARMLAALLEGAPDDASGLDE